VPNTCGRINPNHQPRCARNFAAQNTPKSRLASQSPNVVNLYVTNIKRFLVKFKKIRAELKHLIQKFEACASSVVTIKFQTIYNLQLFLVPSSVSRCNSFATNMNFSAAELAFLARFKRSLRTAK